MPGPMSFNHGVVGSSPTALTNKFSCLDQNGQLGLLKPFLPATANIDCGDRRHRGHDPAVHKTRVDQIDGDRSYIATGVDGIFAVSEN